MHDHFETNDAQVNLGGEWIECHRAELEGPFEILGHDLDTVGPWGWNRGRWVMGRAVPDDWEIPWQDTSRGCWRSLDGWSACNGDPDPDSPTGLCVAHAEELRDEGTQ